MGDITMINVFRYIRGSILPHWISFLFFLIMPFFVRRSPGLPYLMLFCLAYVILCNLRHNCLVRFRIWWALFAISLLFTVYWVKLVFRTGIYANTLHTLFKFAAASALYAIGRRLLNYIMFNDGPGLAEFGDAANPEAITNYPVYFGHTHNPLSVYLEAVPFFGILLVVYGLYMNKLWIAVGLIIIVLSFRYVYIPNKQEMIAAAESAKELHDSYKIPRVIVSETSRRAVKHLKNVSGHPIEYSAGGTVYLTNDEALAYYSLLFGAGGTAEECLSFFRTIHPMEFAMDALATYVYGMHLNNNGQFPVKMKTRDSLSGDYVLDGILWRYGREISSCMHVEFPGTLNNGLAIRNQQINEYLSLLSGHEGERTTYTAVCSADLGKSVYRYINSSLNLNGKTSEHDVLIVCSRGIITLEIKNRQRSVRILQSRQIVDDNNNLIASAAGSNAIDQNEYHISVLRRILPDTVPAYAVKGAVVYANQNAVVFNESDYPVLSLKTVKPFLENLPVILDEAEIEKANSAIQQHITSAVEFPFTDIEAKYDETIESDYKALAGWFRALEEFPGVFKSYELDGITADPALRKEESLMTDMYMHE